MRAAIFCALVQSFTGCTDRGVSINDTPQTWFRVYGGSDSEIPTQILATGDGGFLIVASKQPPGTRLSQAYLIKTDQHGEVEWKQSYFEGWTSIARRAVAFGDGGFVVVGQIEPSGPGRPRTYLLLFRIDRLGDKVWEKRYDTDSVGPGLDIAAAPQDGYTVVGSQLVRIDADGDILWTKPLRDTINEFTGSVHVASAQDGSIFIAGSFRWQTPFVALFDPSGTPSWYLELSQDGISPSCLVSVASDEFVIGGSVHGQAALLALNSSGDTLWYHEYADELPAHFLALTVTASGRILAAGDSEVECIPDAGFGQGRVIARIDPLGQPVWYKTFVCDPFDAAYGIAATADGGAVMCGPKRSPGGDTDIYLIKIDSDGNAPILSE